MPTMEEFAPWSDSLFVQQTVTLAAGASAKLTAEYRFQDHKFDADVLYGVLTSGTLSEMQIVLSASGAAISGEDPIPANFCVMDAPPEVAVLNYTGVRLTHTSTPWAPTVKNNGAGSQTFTVTWRLRKAQRQQARKPE